MNASPGCLNPEHSMQCVMMLYENKRQEALAYSPKSNLEKKPEVLMLRE